MPRDKNKEIVCSSNDQPFSAALAGIEAGEVNRHIEFARSVLKHAEAPALGCRIIDMVQQRRYRRQNSPERVTLPGEMLPPLF